jgi:hypothetical protein
MQDDYEFEGTLMEAHCPSWLERLGCGCLEVMAYLVVVAAGCGLTLMFLAWRGAL